jgi:hypothetical protein
MQEVDLREDQVKAQEIEGEESEEFFDQPEEQEAAEKQEEAKQEIPREMEENNAEGKSNK